MAIPYQKLAKTSFFTAVWIVVGASVSTGTMIVLSQPSEGLPDFVINTLENPLFVLVLLVATLAVVIAYFLTYIYYVNRIWKKKQ